MHQGKVPGMQICRFLTVMFCVEMESTVFIFFLRDNMNIKEDREEVTLGILIKIPPYIHLDLL